MSSVSRYIEGIPGELLLTVKAPATETTEHYRRSARAFVNWASATHRPITTRSFAEWIDWERGQGVKAGKLAMDIYGGKAAIMQAAARFRMDARELATLKVALDAIKAPKLGKPSIRTIDGRQRGLLVAQLDGRLAYLARFLYATAARVSEAIHVRETDIVVDRGSETARIRLLGKGDKERWVRIPREMLAEINALHDYEGRIYLFENKRGRPYSRQTVTAAIRKAAARALGKRVTSHDLRHSRATDLFAKSKNLKGVSEFLGHSEVSTTADYYVRTELTEDELWEGENI